MKVEIFRLAGEPIQVEVRDGGTVKDVFTAADNDVARAILAYVVEKAVPLLRRGTVMVRPIK